MEQNKKKELTPFVLSFLLTAFGFAVYAHTLQAPFIFDDTPTITHNEVVYSIGPLSKYLDLPRGSPVSGRPVSALSFALNYAVNGLNPAGYHLVNIGLHLISAIILFNLILLILRLRPVRFLEKNESLFAFFLSAIWMLHPIQTEAVTYLTQRTELLVSFFYLSVFYAFCRSLISERRVLWQIAALMACCFGMGSKEVMAGCPLLLLFFDRAIASESWREVFARRGRFHALMALTWGILIYLGWKLPHAYAAGFHFKTTAWTYFLTQNQVIMHYLKLVIWPHNLSLDYSDWKVVGSILEVLPEFAVLSILFCASAAAAWRGKILGFAGLSFFFILAPSSSFVPVVTELAAERRIYLALVPALIFPMAGIFFMLRRFPKLITIAGVIICACLAVSTWFRNSLYLNEKVIWEDVLKKRPESVRALNNLSVMAGSEGDYALAEKYIHRAIELNPKQYVESLTNYTVSLELITNYAVALAGQGKLEDARIIFNLIFSVEWKEDRAKSLALAHFNYAKVMEKEGILNEAELHYREAVKLDDGLAQALFNLGLLLSNQGRRDEAQAIFLRLVEIKVLRPQQLVPLLHSKAYYELSQIALARGDYSAAKEYLGNLLLIDPANTEAQQALMRIAAS